MTITSQDLSLILEKHKKWLCSDDGGQRADLQGADLRGAYLQRADLQRADLRGSDLRGADLRGAYLQRADLQRADLRCADLQGSDLRCADLQGSDLRGAYLQRADLRGVKGGELAIAMTSILPAGTLIGWKKCRDDVIVKLEIPIEAKRSHAFGRKCRAEFAKVLEIMGPKGGAREEAVSRYDNCFIYRVGDTVKPKYTFDDDWKEECSTGIHFFITKEEAIAYNE